MIEVACIILMDAGETILVTRRPAHKALGNLWEFPGGKIEDGENPEQALRREIDEELRLPLPHLESLSPVNHQYDFGEIRLIPFLARCDNRPAVHLVEHTEARWISIGEAQALAWAPADLPVVEELKARFPGEGS